MHNEWHRSLKNPLCAITDFARCRNRLQARMRWMLGMFAVAYPESCNCVVCGLSTMLHTLYSIGLTSGKAQVGDDMVLNVFRHRLLERICCMVLCRVWLNNVRLFLLAIEGIQCCNSFVYATALNMGPWRKKCGDSMLSSLLPVPWIVRDSRISLCMTDGTSSEI